MPRPPPACTLPVWTLTILAVPSSEPVMAAVESGCTSRQVTPAAW